MAADSKKKKGFTQIGSVLKTFQSGKDKQSLSLKFSRDKQSLPLKFSRDKQSLSLRFSRDKYISREFQKYGYDLAKELGDLKSVSLYIKLAKETPRARLENAKNFVKDAMNVKSRPKLFMWKLSELKKQAKLTHKRSDS